MDNKLVILLLLYIMASSLKICNWNMRSLSSAGPYLGKLAEDNDIIVASEHRLYNCELYKLGDYLPGYHVHGKSSADLDDSRSTLRPSHCGLFMAWRESMDSQVRVMSVESDRICAIQIANVSHKDKCNLYVIGVYLPHQNCKIADFQTHLNKLEVFIEHCLHDGEVIIIGDINCHFGPDIGVRFTGKSTPHAKQFLKMVNRKQLCILDKDNICTGPTYSFYVEGVGESYVDHVIVSTPVAPSVIDCTMHADTIDNTSDHLALSLTIAVDKLPHQHKTMKPSRVRWDKMTKEEIKSKYTTLLNERLVHTFSEVYESSVLKTEQVSDMVASMTDIIMDVSRPLMAKFNKSTKPYWSKRLTYLSKQEKAIWHQWRAAGQPRSGDLFTTYKQAKKQFRTEQKKAQRQYELLQMDELVQSCEADQSFFWHLANKSRRGTKQRVTPIKIGASHIITNPEEIRQSWQTYFKELYTPKDPPQYDQEFKGLVDSHMEDMREKSYTQIHNLLQQAFTMTEVKQTLDTLKNKKASGYDGITAEHIKFGGDKLLALLVCMCNSISHNECVPTSLKRGIIIPIPKGTKDASIQNNNRGITLVSVFVKLYQKILLKRHLEWADEHDRLDDLQGAGQPKVSSIHTAWLLRETVAANVNQGSPVYVALLDTTKAFDTVWVNGLFHKLFKSNIDGKVWRILSDFYKDFRCCVQIGGDLSDWFTSSQGVHQGEPWSMYLYTKMINDLLKKLRESAIGATIGLIPTSNPTFADDIAIATIHKPLLQLLLNIAHTYSLQWRFEFNASKTEVVIFGTDLCPDLDLKLGDNLISVKDGSVHMGVPLSSDKQYESAYIQDRINSAKRAFYAVQGLGNQHVPVTPVVASKLYWAVCIPRMTHGLEVATLSDNSVEKLEQAHGQMAKSIQGLPLQTSNAACLAPLGWTSMETYLDILKLLFIWRLLLLSINSIYKQVAIDRLCYYMYLCQDSSKHRSPILDMLSVYYKYNIIDVLVESLTTGVYIPIMQFKSLIKSKISQTENNRFAISCMLYKTLGLFRQCIPQIEWWTWWTFAYKRPDKVQCCRIIARLMYGESCLRDHTYKFKGIESKMCIICDMFEPQTVGHMLFECTNTKLLQERRRWFTAMQNVFPQALYNEINLMGKDEKTAFILAGMRIKYIEEWEEIYVCLADHIYAMYKANADLNNSQQ
jgi:hypothetical protein